MGKMLTFYLSEDENLGLGLGLGLGYIQNLGLRCKGQ